MGSTRLPGKVLSSFCGERSILGILIDRLRQNQFETPVVVATSQADADDAIDELCATFKVPCFRGSESDVLQRFLDCACVYEADGVIRVCADNPFLRLDLLERLLKLGMQQKNDYVAYVFNGLPAIQSHLGFFSEYVRVDALRRVRTRTADDSDAREHVTTYLYDHPEQFDAVFIEPPEIMEREPLCSARLTVDTPKDLENTRELYSAVSTDCGAEDAKLQAIVKTLADRPQMVQSMQEQIQQNTK